MGLSAFRDSISRRTPSRQRFYPNSRNSNISSKEIISATAKKIKNKVSLEFPDKIILIEILSKQTGISIIKNSDIVSLEKTKRSISE